MPGIMTSWRQQYDRMLRSFERLTAMAEGRQWADSNDATDALFHFFQDAYHLKDWIAGDRALAQPRLDAEPLFSNGKSRRKNKPTTPAGPLVMQICADVCNGVKHFPRGVEYAGSRRDRSPGCNRLPGRRRRFIADRLGGASRRVWAGCPGARLGYRRRRGAVRHAAGGSGCRGRVGSMAGEGGPTRRRSAALTCR